MEIEVIDHHPEQEFLSWLKWAFVHQRTATVAHFALSQTPNRLTKASIIEAVAKPLEGRRATIYIFEDGDAILSWESVKRVVYDEVCRAVSKYYALPETPELYHFYDLHGNAEQLRFLCYQKMEARPKPKEENRTVAPSVSELGNALPPAIDLVPSQEQLDKYRRVCAQRNKRTKPHILIVEDQTFSRKLLLTILEPTYKVYAAENAVDAFELHLAHAPDIILLDIELPDMNGHDLGAAIRKFDTNVFIIMVTAHNRVEDVARARDNGAKNFIVKPYSKQKILDAIKAFVPSWITMR